MYPGYVASLYEYILISDSGIRSKKTRRHENASAEAVPKLITPFQNLFVVCTLDFPFIFWSASAIKSMYWFCLLFWLRDAQTALFSFSAIGYTFRYGLSHDGFSRACPSDAILVWSFGSPGYIRKGTPIILNRPPRYRHTFFVFSSGIFWPVMSSFLSIISFLLVQCVMWSMHALTPLNTWIFHESCAVIKKSGSNEYWIHGECTEYS